MNDNDIYLEIQTLKDRVNKLEQIITNKLLTVLSFGRSYSKAGSSDTDFLIKTKGQVKILWGNKFIDLIKDGKINFESNLIFSSKEVGKKDGIYVILNDNNTLVILLVKGTLIDLLGDYGNTYVSFTSLLDLTSLLKYIVLSNIGLIYKDLLSVLTDVLSNGIIYVESEKKLYIIENGNISLYLSTITNPFTKLFIIEKNDSDIGAIVIKGDGKENSLAFNSMYLFNNNTDSYLEFKNSLNLLSDDKQILTIVNDKIVINSEILCNLIQSIGANDKKGFRLYVNSYGSVLEVDKIITRS